jgi:hypothetical protein
MRTIPTDAAISSGRIGPPVSTGPYCTTVLHLSEAEAYARITVARASREHPVLLDLLADGRLHLTGIARLAPHLTAENRTELLARATHKSRRQIEELIAEITPGPDTPALMRRLPERAELQAPARPAGAGGSEQELPQLCPDRGGVGSFVPGLHGDEFQSRDASR